MLQRQLPALSPRLTRASVKLPERFANVSNDLCTGDFWAGRGSNAHNHILPLFLD